MGRGDQVHVEALGTLHAARRSDARWDGAPGGAPMRRDTLFRMASLTKPVTAAAVMILVEECRLRLDDPVETWLPELANRRVLTRIDASLDDTVPARRSITRARSADPDLRFRSGAGSAGHVPDPGRHPGAGRHR
ncbi:serine hydrolase domain-containing protein [Streptomyces sp. CS62]|uniref:serine hydrolase domain-containing protein n=1 Tax=Streptomyces sp. CS62 TaxID=3119268 RepID=UPI002F935ED3